MQAFQRPPSPQMPQAPPPPPNPDVIAQKQSEGKMAAREAQGRASTILTRPGKDEASFGVLNKKAPSLT